MQGASSIVAVLGVGVLAGCGAAHEGATSEGSTSTVSEETSAASTTGADVDGSGGAEGGGPGPGPWDHGWPIPAEPQTPGDPDEGWWKLVHEGYISCGVPTSLWFLAQPFMGAFVGAEPLPGREGANADMPYNWTVHVAASGVEIASQNCLQCHAGYFDGELVVGLGTADVDFTQRLDEQLALVPTTDDGTGAWGEFSKFLDRLKALGPYTAMRTVGQNPAEAVAVTLVAHRDPTTLAWSDEPLQPLPEIVVPSDPPPWWRAHKKHALFYNAMARGDLRGTMMLATSLCTDTVAEAMAIASWFDDIHAYINSLREPEYPFAIDASLLDRGEAVFVADCAPCHGTYAEDEADETYPNLLFPLAVVGTDPVVAEGGTQWAPHMVTWYNASFYGSITRMVPDDPWPGYAAPPLDGVWATGPFLHNGSVPSIALVLDSTRRPTWWRRVDHDSTNFDEVNLGWPYLELDHGWADAPEAERKHVYDTTMLAHSNAGHTFGDHLSEDERRAVIEYLKTL